MAEKEARLPGRLPWDIPRPRVPPRLPARLPLRDRCCPSSLLLAPPSPEAGSARAKISRSFWRLHRSRASLVFEGLCQARGRTSLVRGLGTGPCSFPAERLRRPEVCAASQLIALWAARAGKSAPVVVAVVTAASLRTTSVSEVLAEQPLENRVCAAGTLPSPRLYFFSSLHAPVFVFPHFPFLLALLSHRWLEVTYLSALRDMPVFLD